MSKTLDSASAHFAASAVVSAPAPGRSEATKEQTPSHNNINGVVQPSGDDFLKLMVFCRAENVPNDPVLSPKFQYILLLLKVLSLTVRYFCAMSCASVW